MFHKMFDLKGLEKEVHEYRKKISNEEIFIPDNWLPKNFTTEDLRKVLVKAINTGKNFEEFMPSEFKEYLKVYEDGIKKGNIY